MSFMRQTKYNVSDGFIHFKVFSFPYRVSVKLFKLLRWIIVLYAVVSLTMIFSHPVYFVENPSSNLALNPLFGVDYFGLIPSEVSSLEFLPPFFFSGYRMPSLFADSFAYSLLLIFCFAFANHFKYNKDFNRCL